MSHLNNSIDSSQKKTPEEKGSTQESFSFQQPHTPKPQTDTADSLACCPCDQVAFKLDPDIKKVWYIRGIVNCLIASIIVSGLAYFIGDYVPSPITNYLEPLLDGLILLYFVLNTLIGSHLQYKFSSYVICEDAFEIKRGAFLRRTTLIPYRRIQHTQHKQGPLMKHFGLKELTVATASSSFTLDGLKEDRARELAELVASKVEAIREDV